MRTRNGRVTKSPTDHNYAPSSDRVQVTKAVGELKAAAKTSQEPTRNLVQAAFHKLPLTATGQVPSARTLARMIRREREENTAAGIDVTAINGEPFLRVSEPDVPSANQFERPMFGHHNHLRILRGHLKLLPMERTKCIPFMHTTFICFTTH